LNNLASAYEDMGDYAAAEPMFRRSLQLRRAGQDPDSPLIANAEYNLARLLLKQGRLDEAREHDAQAVAIYRKRHGEDDRNVLKVELLEVERMLDAHSLDDAQALFARVLASPAPLSDPVLARRHALAARIAESRHESAKALDASRLAWQTIRRAWGDHHPLTLEYGLDYARQLSRNGERARAREIIASVADLAPAFSDRSPLQAALAQARRSATDAGHDRD
jgi:serine/threonine-protein kinase